MSDAKYTSGVISTKVAIDDIDYDSDEDSENNSPLIHPKLTRQIGGQYPILEHQIKENEEIKDTQDILKKKYECNEFDVFYDNLQKFEDSLKGPSIGVKEGTLNNNSNNSIHYKPYFPKINCVPFELHPEKYQPSGSFNHTVNPDTIMSKSPQKKPKKSLLGCCNCANCIKKKSKGEDNKKSKSNILKITTDGLTADVYVNAPQENKKDLHGTACQMCALYYPVDILKVNENMGGLISCWHCFFWTSTTLEARLDLEEAYDLTLDKYILKCLDDHNYTKCTRDPCELCNALTEEFRLQTIDNKKKQDTVLEMII